MREHMWMLMGGARREGKKGGGHGCPGHEKGNWQKPLHGADGGTGSSLQASVLRREQEWPIFQPPGRVCSVRARVSRPRAGGRDAGVGVLRSASGFLVTSGGRNQVSSCEWAWAGWTAAGEGGEREGPSAHGGGRQHEQHTWDWEP